MNTITRMLSRDGEQIRIRPLAFELLSILVESHGVPINKQELIKRVWGNDAFGSDATLHITLADIRRVLGESAKNPRFIRRTSSGYLFIAQVLTRDNDSRRDSGALESTLPMISEPTPTSTDSFTGLILKGKYQVVSEIASGGMGRVYLAKHLGLLKDIAIKIIDKRFASNPIAIERFRREARAAAKLRHPNIVTILDFDETPGPNRRPFIVMEMVLGRSLTSVLRSEGKLTIERAVHLMLDVCKAVAVAHRNEVIHRDIKPDNIMVIAPENETPETIKVLDFGLAKIRESEEYPAITHFGMVMGTPFYMSPEQCRGEELDPRSDVYSLATVLYEMLSGTIPFSGSNIMSVCFKHQSATVPPFHHSLNVPEEIAIVIQHGLEKLRERRPLDAQHFGNELRIAYEEYSTTRR